MGEYWLDKEETAAIYWKGILFGVFFKLGVKPKKYKWMLYEYDNINHQAEV